MSLFIEPDSSSDYRVSGPVDIAVWSDHDDVVFEGVTLCSYSAEGALLDSTRIGDFSMPLDTHHVNTTFEQRPRYIVLDHPEFREYGLWTHYVLWTNETFREEGGSPGAETQQFAYRPPERPGTCGATS